MTATRVELGILVDRVFGRSFGNLVIVLADPLVETGIAVAPRSFSSYPESGSVMGNPFAMPKFLENS